MVAESQHRNILGLAVAALRIIVPLRTEGDHRGAGRASLGRFRTALATAIGATGGRLGAGFGPGNIGPGDLGAGGLGATLQGVGVNVVNAHHTQAWDTLDGFKVDAGNSATADDAASDGCDHEVSPAAGR